MHERFIARTREGLYGEYGYGKTEAEALANLKKAGGKIRKSNGTWKPTKGVTLEIRLFTSELPFAPTSRPAEKTEADAWVGKEDGAFNWVRCEMKTVSFQ